MKILVATNNADKAREIFSVLQTCDLGSTVDEVVTLKDVGVVSDPVEDGKTFTENSCIKAHALADLIGKSQTNLKNYIIIADDSGLCVDALDGVPGVYSARYAQDQIPLDQEKPTHAQNNNKLLAELDGFPAEKRTAHFVTAGVMLVPKSLLKNNLEEQNQAFDQTPQSYGDYLQFNVEGVCSGHIATTPKGDGGFGYDPLFYADVMGGEISNAQLTPEQKDEIRHRGNAIRDLSDILSRLF